MNREDAKENLANVRADLSRDQQHFRFQDLDLEAVASAFTYIQGYPWMLFAMIENTKAMAKRNPLESDLRLLRETHKAAIEALIHEAEKVSFDASALWEFGRICRELVDANKAYRSGIEDFWPDCLRDARRKLPLDYRESIRLGEAALMRLGAKLDVPVTSSDMFSVKAICDMTGLRNGAIGGYAKRANVTPAKRGEKNKRFTADETEKILREIANTSGDPTVISKCKASLQNRLNIAI